MDKTAATALFLANLAIAVCVVRSGWGYYQAIMVFWLEAIVIGAFNTLKLYVAALFGHPFGRWIGFSSKLGAIALVTAIVAFFLVKFGGFVVALGLGVLLLPAWLAPEGESDLSLIPHALEGAAPGTVACVALLISSHAISFVMNFLRHREYESASALYLLFSPYVRLLYLLVTFVVALTVATLQPAIAQTTTFAAVLVAVKLGTDLFNHRCVHERLAGNRAATSQPPAAMPQTL